MLHVWEEHSARAVVKARTIVRGEIKRMGRMGLEPNLEDGRIAELDAICDILNEALAHIDPHVEIDWHEETPLP